MNGKSLRFAAMTLLVVSCALVLHGCNGGGDAGGEGGGANGGPVKFLNMGTSKLGTFPQVGNSLCVVLNKNAGDNNWKAQGKGSSGSQENIRLLDKGEFELALANSAISYHAVRGTSGWDKKYDIRAVVTISPLVAMFVTRQDSGIQTMEDLKGKRVACGPNGAGLEMFLEPLLEAHGLTFDDFNKINANFPDSVSLLGDGGADAIFLGGPVPSPHVTLASELGIHFIPFDDDARKKLVKNYPFFSDITVKAGTYEDLTTDFNGLNVGTMHLITAASQDEEFIYQVTKTLWENRAKNTHPAPKNFITKENAARYTGTDFHPGAIRFYKEIGIWPAAAKETDQSETPADAPETDSEPSGDASDSQ